MKWLRNVLFIASFLLLGYCGLVTAESWRFQKLASDDLNTLVHLPAQKPGMPEKLPPSLAGVVGRIEVPRLGISVIVSEGASGSVLRRSAGHIPGTAVPGEPGNVGISAHRDTFFRPLRNIRGNDIVTVTTLSGEFRYRVVSTSIVAPNDISVLDQSSNEVLTLVTCYPFYFIGSAPNRFIVRAERII